MLRIWILLALAGTAHAGYLEETFAQQLSIDEKAIAVVAGFELPGFYNRVIVGTYRSGDWTMNAAVLMRCDDAHCKAKPVWLGNGTFEVLGVADLKQSGALPTRRVELPRDRWFKPLGGYGAWPALLVQTTTSKPITTKSYSMRDVRGSEVRTELSILSLARADADDPRVLREVVVEHYPTGVGQRTTFEVDKDALFATEQRSIDNELACIPPKPTKTRYVLDARRKFQREAGPFHAGC